MERKSDNSVVTRADKEAERCIRACLASGSRPAYPVLGEEMGDDSAGARFRWTIDPIDGTLGYTRGLPTFGTLLAFEDATAEQALVGVIHLPSQGQTYWAAKGRGAFYSSVESPLGAVSRQSICVAPRRSFDECVVSLSGERDFRKAGEQAGYARICEAAGFLRGNHDCWTHAMTVRGAVDVTVEHSLSRWDIAATQIIVAEAGGRCLIRPSRVTPKKFDCLFGSPTAVDEVAVLLPF